MDRAAWGALGKPGLAAIFSRSLINPVFAEPAPGFLPAPSGPRGSVILRLPFFPLTLRVSPGFYVSPQMVTKETGEISAPAATGETLKVASGIPSANINVHSQEIFPNKPVGSLSHERTVGKRSGHRAPAVISQSARRRGVPHQQRF